MSQLSLALLGPPVVARDGVPQVFDTKKATAMLAVLALSSTDRSREQLAGLLWPDSDAARSRGSLRRTLSVTAAKMGDGLVITRSTVALRAERVAVDVTDFEALVARADTTSMGRAVALYRDDFLAGFSLRDCPEFDQWQSQTADRLRRLLGGTLERLVAAHDKAGQLDVATGYAHRWLALDTLHEPAYQALIGLLARSGQRSAALGQYRELVRVLDRELAVQPLPATTRLYDDVRAGRLAPPATPSTLGASPTRAEAPSPAAAGAPAQSQEPTGQHAPAGPPARPDRWPMVGRVAELRSMSRAWRAVGPGGEVVAVLGEAGGGKTRLLAEFASTIEAAGASVVTGRCHEGEAGLPFALTVDLLAAALADSELVDRLPAHVVAVLGRLAPGLVGGFADGAAPPLSSPGDLTRLYAAVGTVLVNRAQTGQGPGVVLVDDVHWADGPSLALLAYLVHRLPDWPLLLVVSFRPEQAEGMRALRSAVTDAVDGGRGRLVPLSPLGADEIGAVLRAANLTEPDPARMLAHTRGLPLLVHEYAQAQAAGQLGPSPAGAEQPWSAPASVRELMGRRLDAASEATRQLLSAVAVLSGGCDPELARAVSGRGEAETVDSLDEAVARFLLTESAPLRAGGSPTYEFPYEGLRQVAYESTTLARRRLLHSRAADALTARFDRDRSAARAAVVAGQLQEAGREAESAQWWWQAALLARDLAAHAEAYADLRQALALGYPQAPALLGLGDVLTALGRYREAVAAFETGAATSDGADALAAGFEHRLAEVHHRLGDWDLAEAHLAAAADLVGAADYSGQARVEADRAVVAYRRGDFTAATEFAGSALSHARQGNDPAALAQSLNAAGMLAARRGETAAAEEQLRDSLRHARSAADRGAQAAALNNLARLLADTGRRPEALAYATEALARGVDLGDQHRVAALHTNLADLLHAAGHREAAVQHLKEAARGFAALETGASLRPEIWTLVEW